MVKRVDDSSNVSIGSLGAKIKRYRELRGFSQRELGIRCGFPAGSADVRIAQYESNKKIPRDDALEKIAHALEIDVNALFDTNILNDDAMYHVLFDVEDLHGLHPVRINGSYYLEFSGSTSYGREINRFDYESFLSNWYDARQKYTATAQEATTDFQNANASYTLWKAEYPQNVAAEHSKNIRAKMKLAQMEAQVDRLYAETNSAEALTRLDSIMQLAREESSKADIQIRKESDLIILIYHSLEAGLPLTENSPETKLDDDYSRIHLISIKIEDLEESAKNRELFATIEAAIKVLIRCGIRITRRITAHNKLLYLTYEYPADQSLYLTNLRDSWKDIRYILERKGTWSEREIRQLEQSLINKVSSANDINYSTIE